MRMAAIRGKYSVKKEQDYKKQKVNKNIKMVKIEIPCMCGCGEMVKVEVAKSKIIPHLGKPRGLHLRCTKCNQRTRLSGSMTHREHCCV